MKLVLGFLWECAIIWHSHTGAIQLTEDNYGTKHVLLIQSKCLYVKLVYSRDLCPN